METFTSIHRNRKKFIKSNEDKSFAIVEGKGSVLLSAPHGVSQVRFGREKYEESGSLATALCLQNRTNFTLIGKTRNENDDANFDEESPYKDAIDGLIYRFNIKYIVDFHGLKASRPCDINLGINLGQNIETDIPAFDRLCDALKNGGFVVFVDQPFMANIRTVSGFIHNKFPDVWTIQMEINSAITNRIENFSKFQRLLHILEDWLLSLVK